MPPSNLKTNTGGLPIIWRDTASPDKYEQARRRVFNAKVPERYPNAIVLPENVAHIQTGIELAEELGCRVAVRSGGHSWACWSVRDKTILIDLVNFSHLKYDTVTDTLEASPSTKSMNGATYLREHGRFLPFGHCGDVGIGGFLLQGGMGLNCRGYGWGCQYIKAIDVVTANKELKHCDHEQNEDLLWAARGCGPSFPGIITRFYLESRPFPPLAMRYMYFWPISEYDQVMKWTVDICAKLSEDLEPIISSAVVPQFKQRVFIFMVTAYGSSEADIQDKTSIIKNTRPPNALHTTEDAKITLETDYDFAEVMTPRGHRWIADNVYVSVDVDLVEVCRKSWTTLPDECLAYYEPLKSRPLSNMAMSMQSDHYVALYSATQDVEQEKVNGALIAECMLELQKSSVGAYMGDADFQIRPTKFWSDEVGNRLKQIREHWDPKGRFCRYLTKGDNAEVNVLDNNLHTISATQ